MKVSSITIDGSTILTAIMKHFPEVTRHVLQTREVIEHCDLEYKDDRRQRTAPGERSDRWTFEHRCGKRLPLLLIRTYYYETVIEMTDGKWELGVRKLPSVLGYRLRRKSGRTNRWGEANEQIKAAVVNLINSNVLLDMGSFVVLAPEPVTVCLTLMDSQDEEKLSLISIPKWLSEHKIDPTSKKMQLLISDLELIKQRHIPGKTTSEWVEGPAIVDAYAKEPSSSCMRGADNRYLTEMYASNPGKVKMLIIRDGNKWVARCLVWIKTKKDGQKLWYPVRVYPPGCSKPEACIKLAIETEAKEQGVEVRWLRDWDPTMTDYLSMEKKRQFDDDACPVFVMELNARRIVPYMDTLIYGALTSPTQAVFSRSPQFLPRHPKFNPDGREIPGLEIITPVTAPRATGGGVWRTDMYKCTCCNGEYQAIQVSDLADPNSKESITRRKWAVPNNICDACFAKDWVQYWHPNGTVEYCHKKHCEYSEPMRAWVYLNISWRDQYLTRNKDGQWVIRGQEAIKDPGKYNPYEDQIRMAAIAFDELMRFRRAIPPAEPFFANVQVPPRQQVG